MTFSNIKLGQFFVALIMLVSVAMTGLALAAPKVGAQANNLAAEVEFTNNEDCEGGGIYTIPRKHWHRYQVNGTVRQAGTYNAAAGETVTVKTYKYESKTYKRGWFTYVKFEWVEKSATSFTFAGNTCGETGEPSYDVYAPEPVVFTEPTCEGIKGTYTIPNSELAHYFLEGSDATLEPGTYDAETDSTVSIYAQPIGEEYYFEDGVNTDWSHTFTLGDCTLPAVDEAPQVTIKPTGAVDAGAGPAVAAMAALLASASLVSVGAFLKKKSL